MKVMYIGHHDGAPHHHDGNTKDHLMVHGVMFARHVPVHTTEPSVLAHVKSSPYFRVMRDTIDEDYSTPGPHAVEQPRAPYPADVTQGTRHNSRGDLGSHKYPEEHDGYHGGPWPGDLTAPRHPASPDHPAGRGFHPASYRPEHDGGVIPHAPGGSEHYGHDDGDGHHGDHLGHPRGYTDGYHDGHRDGSHGRPNMYSYHLPPEHEIDQ